MSRIALIVPCLNEELALPTLFAQAREHIPDATIHVFDNGSTDRTLAVAQAHGAITHHVPERGKGQVVARMFADVDADIYLMTDGDGTYDLSRAAEHVRLVREQRVDMVIGSRRATYGDSGSRPGHRFGNWFLTRLLGLLFRRRFEDVLSGYRVMSRRFVKTAPVLASGFEIEVMLTVHALEVRSHIVEVPVNYLKRAGGSASKLNTFRDGMRILGAIVYLFKEVRPFSFFNGAALLLATLSLLAGLPVVTEYQHTGLVPRFPTAILAASLMLAALISATCGLILDSVAAQRRETKRLHFLQQPDPRTAR
ncbi:MAG: glycosyltransferase [Pseudomonadota bacterium]